MADGTKSKYEEPEQHSSVLMLDECFQWHQSIKLCLNHSDVQKFPLRMKDNDLLVTELYRDPTEDAITALSVYLTPKTSRHFPRSPSTSGRWRYVFTNGHVSRRQRELDRDRLRHQLRGREGHRPAPGDGGLGPAALPDLLCPPQPRHQDHAVGETPDLR